MARTSVGEILQRWWRKYKDIKTPFDEIKVSQRTPIIQINGSYDTSLLRDVIKTSGTAEVSSINSEFKLSINATGDEAAIATASRGKYIPGYAGEVGIGVRLPELPTGDGVAKWGYFDFQPGTQNIKDGAFFGADKDEMFISLYRNGIEQYKIRQSEWDNPTNIDLSKGYIFQIVFVYYGYGPVWFRLVDPESENIITLHKIIDYGAVTFSNSNLQVSAQVTTDATGEPFDFYVSGRQFAILGTPIFQQRKVGHIRKGVNIPTDRLVPIMSFRRKPGRRSVSIQIAEFEALTDNDIRVQWRVNSDINATEWITPSDHNADEVALEVNVDATTIDVNTGIKVDEDIAPGGGGAQARQFVEGETPVDIPDEYIVTLCARSIDSAAATGTIIGKMIEER